MGKLLFDSQPLVIDRTLAKVIGLNESIVLQQIHYWLEINAKKKINFHKGRYWTYNSAVEWQENDFIFWSVRTIERTIKNLEEVNLLISDNFNTDRRDRTKWYSIDYNKLDALEQEYSKKQTDNLTECKQTDCQNAFTQSDRMTNRQLDGMHSHNMCVPLPENSTESSSENTNLSNQMEFETIDNMLKYYSELFRLPEERIISTYDRVKDQYKAGNIKTSFRQYLEKALEQEKKDYEVNKFIL